MAGWIAGAPRLAAPWLTGDEHIFLVNNSDVAIADGEQDLLRRWSAIFLHTHEDLYQPVAILSYAIEWRLWGAGRIAGIRRTDVLLHVLNGFLVWLTLCAVWRHFAIAREAHTKDGQPGTPQRFSAAVPLVAWGFAMLWLLHPVQAGVYAADMGRTHLLSATFSLLALLAYLRHLRGGSVAWFVLAAALLVCGMLSKPMTGWAGIYVLLEAHDRGLRGALRSPRLYVLAGICAAFALLTLRTSQSYNMLDDTAQGVFGDPLSRALVSTWISLTSIFAPTRLTTWYPPDPDTGWNYWPVWAGLFVLAGTLMLGVWAWRSARLRVVGLGILWFWMLYAPVSGIVGVRIAAANDRYLYQPLIGVLIAVGYAALRARPFAASQRAPWFLGVGLGAAAMLLLPLDMSYTARWRSTLDRARATVERRPGDPRALVMLSEAYDFSSDHLTWEMLSDDAASQARKQADYRRLAASTLTNAARAAEQMPEAFTGPADAARFHSRASYNFLRLGDRSGALRAALAAAALAPENPITLVRLAHAHRANGQIEESLAAYLRLETLMPADFPGRALRLIELGDLLVGAFNQPAAAAPRYEAALRSNALSPEIAAQTRSKLEQCRQLMGAGER